MLDKLSIANEMAQFDLKNREFYDELTDQERKKFSNYLMIRWGSCVQGDRDMQEYYVLSTNEHLNRDFFAINRHPKLQWLCATVVSPGAGVQRHQWIPPRKKEPGAGTMHKQLAVLFPHLKADEIEVLARITTRKELAEYLKQLGEE